MMIGAANGFVQEEKKNRRLKREKRKKPILLAFIRQGVCKSPRGAAGRHGMVISESAHTMLSVFALLISFYSFLTTAFCGAAR
jgi:hypothetical protein